MAKMPKFLGTYAANCLQARRLAERDVKFIQLYHTGWDQHGNLPSQIKKQALATDQATAGLIKDLKQRGLLEDTLVIWGVNLEEPVFHRGGLLPKIMEGTIIRVVLLCGWLVQE